MRQPITLEPRDALIMSHSYPSDISREQFARIRRIWSRPASTQAGTVDLYDVFCRRVLINFAKAQQVPERRMLPVGLPQGSPGQPATSISSNGSSGLTQAVSLFWSRS